MVEPTCKIFKEWADSGKPVLIIRMDNAGENTKLVQLFNGKIGSYTLLLNGLCAIPHSIVTWLKLDLLHYMAVVEPS